MLLSIFLLNGIYSNRNLNDTGSGVDQMDQEIMNDTGSGVYQMDQEIMNDTGSGVYQMDQEIMNDTVSVSVETSPSDVYSDGSGDNG